MHTALAAPHEAWSKRPRFAPRQLLDAERLNAAFDDELERQRLLNVALHGWGVVFGFGVGMPDIGCDGRPTRGGCVLVTCGLALDPFGRMLHTKDRWLSLADMEGRAPCHEGTYTLFVHHAERLDPPVHDACSGTGPQWREYGVVFSLGAGCEPVDDCCPELTGPCQSRTDYVRHRIGSDEGPPGRAADLRYACDRPGALQATRCGSWCYDPAAGVPVACLEICVRDGSNDETKKGTCDEPCVVIGGVCTDDCSPVRHVYRSPLLHELLSCCDVDAPRVRSVSWQAWMERTELVPWREFSARIQVADENQADDGLAIWFTHPIRTSTLTTASVIVTVFVENDVDYWIARRVPIQPRPLDVVGELAGGVQLVAKRTWVRDEVIERGVESNSALLRLFRVEVTIRGQLLRDECGHMLDAVPIDVGCSPCQGRPGDDLIWAFEVGVGGPYGGRRGGPDPLESTRQGDTT